MKFGCVTKMDRQEDRYKVLLLTLCGFKLMVDAQRQYCGTGNYLYLLSMSCTVERIEDTASTHPNLLSLHMLIAGVISGAFASVPRYSMHEPGYFVFKLNIGVPHTLQKCFFPASLSKLLSFPRPSVISSDAKGNAA
jgi:hypothetical protein